jgi:hypothetical protein
VFAVKYVELEVKYFLMIGLFFANLLTPFSAVPIQITLSLLCHKERVKFEDMLPDEFEFLVILIPVFEDFGKNINPSFSVANHKFPDLSLKIAVQLLNIL